MAKTASLDNKYLKILVKKSVISVFREILSDPDYGLELRLDFVKRLKKSVLSEKREEVVSLDKILKKYNL